MIPEHVAQPPLGHPCQVVAASGRGEPAAEVAGLDEPGLAAVVRAVIDTPQALRDHGGDHVHPGVAVTGQPGGPAARCEIEQGGHPASAAYNREALQGSAIPAGRAGRLSVRVHAPLDLSSHQGLQPRQVDRPVPVDGLRGQAPPAERHLIAGQDRRAKPLRLENGRPAHGKADVPRAPGRTVTVQVNRAKAHRGGRQARADGGLAGTVTRDRRLSGQPLPETGRRHASPVPPPAHPVTLAQLGAAVHSRPLRADAARPGAGPARPPGRHRGREELRPAGPGPRGRPPEPVVTRAQPRPVCHALAPGDLATPPVDQVTRGDLDQVRTENRIEPRSGDERGQQLKAVAAGPAALPGGQHRQPPGHSCPSHTCASAAANTGSCMSACP